jgi:hypothetical protein
MSTRLADLTDQELEQLYAAILAFGRLVGDDDTNVLPRLGDEVKRELSRRDREARAAA